MKRLALLTLFLGFEACRCGNTVTPVDRGFRVSTDPIDFGRVLEGQQATRKLTISAETIAGVTVSVSVSPRPKFLSSDSIDVPGGGQADLDLVFNAGNGVSTGTVTLTLGEKSVSVPLRGVGVRPLVCVASAPCRISEYSLELDRCVESVAADNTACDTGNLCLEQGRCRSGDCLGVARSCNDNDECTIDACSPETGCVYSRKSCPTPTHLCRVASCDPRSGCGESQAPDLYPCGPVDCVHANLCFLGNCMQIDTPDGFDCAPPVACLPGGQCHNQRCQRADAGVWMPKWSAHLEGVPVEERPMLLSSANNLYFTACGYVPLPPDAGPDAGLDGGADGGASDGGGDGGGDDGGADGGDGGSDGGPDGGPDAGPTPAGDGGVCALVSYTGTGFQRFTTQFDGPAQRRLVQVSPRGVVVLSNEGLELRARSSGALISQLDAGGLTPRMVATRTDGTLFVALPLGPQRAGLAEWSDAGVRLHLAPLTLTAPIIALDEQDVPHLWDSTDGILNVVSDLSDGGVQVLELRTDGGNQSLAVASGSIAFGGSSLALVSSGALTVRALPDWDADAGVVPFERFVLLSGDALFTFYRRCESLMMSCTDDGAETWVRVVDAQTGALRWDALVIPPGPESLLTEAALVNPPGSPPGVASLVRADIDGGAGSRAYFMVHVNGARTIVCPLPAETRDLRGAVLSSSDLFIVSARSDGGVVLEDFPLNGLPVQSYGWPQADGVQGLRSATR